MDLAFFSTGPSPTVPVTGHQATMTSLDAFEAGQPLVDAVTTAR